MKCMNHYCDADQIEKDDNFCYKCGDWTTKGYSYLKDKNNVAKIANGYVVKQDRRFTLLASISLLGFFLFFLLLILRGGDIFRPVYFIKRKVDNLLYGYNTAIINTNNIYNKKEVNSKEEAEEYIIHDLNKQYYKCSYSLETLKIADSLENKYDITNISLCDVPYKEAEKIANVIDKMYLLFPNIKGGLTNISITNASTKDEYIARFQPMFQFVNPKEDINSYNKVNKTQILLNSYYFLNDSIISKPIHDVVGKNFYVKDATFESTISHELGHYITFKAFLNSKNIDNIIFVTKDNEKLINDVLEEYDKGEFSKQIIIDALNNYNNLYNTNLDLNSFALTISEYAGIKNNKNELLADETIAEAIHDYYLHGNDSKLASLEIVKVINSKL